MIPKLKFIFFSTSFMLFISMATINCYSATPPQRSFSSHPATGMHNLPAHTWNNKAHHNQPANNNQVKDHHGRNYYYNDTGPYYVAPLDDDSYYYSTTEDNEDEDEQSGETWVAASNGDVPDNAIGFQGENNVTMYHCRSLYGNQMYYGNLIPNDGCYTEDQMTTLRFVQYEVLVQSD